MTDEPHSVAVHPRVASWWFLRRVAYREALTLQTALASRLLGTADPRRAGWVLLLEHPPVYTIGLTGSEADIRAEAARTAGPAGRAIAVERSDRGGKTTYHGPGQLVGYPVLRLDRLGLGPAAYVSGIEQAILDSLAGWGVEGHRVEGRPGIFVRSGKIASIGVRIRHGVATHGFAVNVSVDLAPFGGIVACGDPGGRATSLDRFVSPAPGLVEAARALATCLARVFRLEMVEEPPPIEADRDVPAR